MSDPIETVLREENNSDTPIEPKNHGPLPKFQDLLQSIVIPISQVKRDPTQSRTLSSRKYEIVLKFIRNYRWTVGDNVYPVARLLIPERDQRLYHVKELKLSELIIQIYKIPPGSSDYMRLKKWKRLAENKFGRGDHGFAEVCCEVIKFRGALDVEGGVIGVHEVNQFLDEFGKPPEGTVVLDHQKRLLDSVLQKMNLDEIRYLIKIMLKLKILKGMETSFLRTWHPDAPRLLDLINDMQRVLYQLHSTRISLQDTSIQLAYPFKPQLASRTNLQYEQIVQLFPQGFYIEEKVDGERMQLHMDNQQFHYFSRRATDYTSLYGLDSTHGALTPYIQDCFIPSVRNIVLDGEMLVFDHKRQKLLPFGFLKGSALNTINDANDDVRPMFVVYDLVYLNDVSFEKASLRKRRQALETVLKPIDGVIEIIKYYTVSKLVDIERALRKAIEINSEGIIIKDPHAPYAIAERNKQWIKLKPEYLDEFGEDVDLIIIGRTRLAKTTYMCGLRDGDDVVSFCSIANGISHLDYTVIDKHTMGEWQDIKKRPVSGIKFGSRLPEEWISPEKSVVIQVKARSIDIGQMGAAYYVGTTLYNAYLKRVRLDKSYEDSLSLEEYKEISMTKSYRLHEKQSVTVRKKPKVEEVVEEIEIKSHLFGVSGICYYVLSDMISPRIAMTQLMKLIRQHGGRVIVSLSDRHGDNVVIFSDKTSLKALQLYNDHYDIFKPCWIMDCIKLERIINFEPNHCLLVNEVIKGESYKRVDQYGDSYILPVCDNLLPYIDHLHITDETKLPIDHDMFQNELYYLFYGFSFCIMSDEDHIKLKCLIRLYHGDIIDNYNKATHIMILNSDPKWCQDRKDAILLEISQKPAEFGKLSKIPRIVDEEWVYMYINNFTSI